MEDEGIDALVATTPENVFYLSDYGNQHNFHFAPWGLSAAIFPRDSDRPATLIMQEWELPHLAEQPSWMPELRVQTGGAETFVPEVASFGPAERRVHDLWMSGRRTGLPNRQRLIGKVLKDLGLDRAVLAFDDARVMLELQERELAGATAREAVNVFRHIRVVKTPDELDKIRCAAKVNQAALESTAALVGEGVSCRELLYHYLASMSEQGGYGSHMTGGGVNHPWLTYPDLSYRLKRGDIYHMDPAGHYGYYWADLGRSAPVGGATAKFTELYGVLQQCHVVVDPMLVAGMSTSEIKARSREEVKDAMPEGFVVFLHSIGLEQYDNPQALGTFLTDDFVLEKDMTVNYEILYFEYPWGILQLEDTYLVGSSGPPERLASLPQEPFYR